jgi:hypothetical protein
MKVDAFTYALMNNIDPVTGQPLPGSFGPKQFANELYSPNPQRGMPGSGGASSNMVGYHPGMDYQTVRSANQPVIESFLNGLGSNIVVGTIGKIGEGIGMITNIPSAIAAGDINKLYDNSITNAFERLQENTKENLPIYQGRKYEGNILSKMMTDDFWFNDGFDAVSFLLSAYAPGALAGKAAKLSRLGKLAAPLNELGTKASSVKVANLLKGVTAEGLESGFTQGISTAYNTITEAGFEAKDTFDHTFEEYKKTLPEEEARKKASEAAARVFSANMVGLLVPNAIQSSFMHGTNSFNMKRIKDLVHSNKPLDDILKNRASYLANISKGIASEGLWEENFQNAVQRYEDQMAQGWVGNRAGEYAYGLMLGLKGTAKAFVPFLPAPIAGTDEDEAATAVALGGLIGGGMAAFSTQKERENLKRVTEGVQGNWNRVRLSNALGKKFLVDNYTVGLKDYGTVDELDADGNPTGNRVLNYKDPVTGQVTVDPAKMTNLIMRRMRDMDISAAQVDATLSNDKTLQDLNREMALMSYAWHLKSIPNLSKEDLDDLIKYDIQLPVSKDLDGVVTEDLLSKNISKLHKYIQLYDKTESAVGGMYDFSSQASDRDFGATMRRSYFYDASKKLAFEHMKENASDTQKAQIDTIIQEIDTHLNSFSRLIPQFKDAYDKEIATNITNGKRLDEIDTLLKDKNTKDEDKVNLEVEKRRINYVLEEAVNVDNYYAEEFGGERATEYASASLSRNEPAVHARKRGQQHAPLSMSEKYYYNKALTELFNIEIAKDLSSATPVENIIEKVRHRPELALTADNEVRLRESLAARVAEVEDASSAESLEAIQQEMNSAIELDYRGGRNSLIETEEENEEYQSFLANNYVAIESAAKLVHGDSNPYTLDALSENPNMFLDLYRDIDRTAKAQRTQEAKVKAYQDILDKVHTESENLKADNAVLDKQSNEQRAESFKEIHFNDKTNDIRLTIDKYQKDKDNFAERVDGKIAALKVYKEIFSSRTDISEALRDRIIAKIDKWIELLTEAMEVASKNLAKRYEIQKLSEVSYTEGLKTLIKDPVFEEVLRSILGNELDTMLKEISSYSEKKDSMEGYEALLETVRRKATPEQLKSIETTIVEISNREGAAVKQVLKDGVQKLSGKKLVIPFGALENIRGNRGVFLTNPLAAISRFLFDSRLFGERVEAPYNASGELTPFQRYKLDLDFPKLMYELSDKNFEGLNQTEKELLQALYEIYYKARAYHAVLNITQSGVDSLELYKYEAAEFGSTDKKTPTAQQAISVREAARQINNSSLTNNQSAVFGIFGSGKTVMVAKKIMNFLVPKKDRKNKILAFAQSEATSEKIANSVEGTQTSYKEFIAMPAEKVTQFEYLVIDEAFTLHSNQIDVIDSYARTVGIKVLYLGDPSQNKSEDTAMLQNNITQAQPLTVVLRTNNPAITKFATSFQHNPLAVNEVIAESTSTLTNKTEKDSGVFVTAKDKVAEEQIVELAKRNNGKTKLIISNHNLAYYKEKLQGTNVKVLSPYDSQGQEADEVYLDLSKQGEAVNGGPLRGDLPFNTMMATAASRAVNTLVVANRPGLNIIPVILHNLEESILNLENEFAQYEEDYKTSLNAYKHFYSKFTGISLQGPKESTIINTKDAPSPGKVVDDKEEPTPVTPEPTPVDGDMVLRYSSNDNTKDIFTGEGLVVRAVVGNEGVEKEKWVVMAPSAEGFRIAGVLSADEIKTGSFTLDQLKRAESRKEVFKLATNKTIAYSREQLQPFVIAPIQIKYVRPLSFSFGDRNPITTASINWLMRNFFNKEGIPLEGTIDSKLRIYTNPSSQQPDTKFQPKAGVPYVVLRGYNVPEKNKSNFPNLLHIPVQAPKLNTSHKTVKSLTKLKTSFDTLSNLLGKDPRTFFNSEEFETMLDKFVNLHTVDPIGDTNRIVRVADFDQKIDAFQEQFKVKQEALVPLFDVMTSLYGVGKNDTRFTLEEYEQWKKDNPDLANNSHWKEITFKKRKEGDPVYGRVTYAEMRRNGKMRTRNVEHYIISQNAGDAALAWDDIASSNKNLGGYFPRILVNRPSALSQTKTKFVAKALLGHKDSHRRAFQIIKDTFFRRYQQIVNNILAEIDPNDPNKPYLVDLEDDLDMYARTKVRY